MGENRFSNAEIERMEAIADRMEKMLPLFIAAMTLIAALLAAIILWPEKASVAESAQCAPTTETEAVLASVDEMVLFVPKKQKSPQKSDVEIVENVENEEVIHEEYFLNGIDISCNQGKIDVEKTAEALEFVVIRLGASRSKDGECVLDGRFYEYVSKFEKANVSIALYWASHSISAEDVARENKFILDALAQVPYKVQEKIHYFFIDREDVDRTDSRTYRIDKDLFNEVLSAQIWDLEYWLPEHMQVGVYTNRSDFISKFDPDIIGNVPYWVAWWCPEGTDTTNFDALFASIEKRAPHLVDYFENIVMWQYSNKGNVDGITENVVDLNVVSSKVLH